MGTFLTILWMCGLQSASVKAETPVEGLFTDSDRSNIILFLAKCVTVIDPRVRKSVSHYGHVPTMYVAGDGDALWSDKGNAVYDWMCNRM